ncbi:MAG: tRNA (N6-threonylcarbamoyladenosine(37)-N6)-methyltransferase TrmO [Lachnospiraceae bacterium]|nr:tRNA (N6-threonylcarbamoyladenosine(37)-N6)-methyltransferase TrmO [Lachnospiraceae bacterium]
MKIIARIETDFPEKFGIPRQSGLVEELKGTIVFEPEYRNKDALKGLEGYNYIWLLWQFEGVERDSWSVTVRPPRLGGNKHMGVFATRSPFRPNPIGLSSVRLEKIESDTERGPVLHVAGVDLRHNTPIYDIKPYLPYVDCHTDATGGFAHEVKDYELKVEFSEALLERIPEEKRQAIIAVLKQDPRPSYHNDPTRQYGVSFAGFNVRFVVDGGVLTVVEVER